MALGEKPVDTTSCKSDDSDADSDEGDNVVQIKLDHGVPASYFNNIEVNNSTGIHFGNTAVYNGPVTVQQFVNNNSEITTKNGQNIAESALELCDKINVTPVTQHVSIIVQKPANGNWCKNIIVKKRFFIPIISFTLIMFISSIVIFILLFPTDFNDGYIGEHQPVINGTIGKARYYKRIEWLAQPVTQNEKFKIMPLDLVIISHTATEECFSNSQCIFLVRKIQTFHIESLGWADIGYNFLVGGDGGIYEGRGWEKIGAHAFGYNYKSIGISLIGTFNEKLPSDKQIKALKFLIEEGVRLNKISKDYKLLGHRQVSSTESPGKTFYEELLTKLAHWSPTV